MTNLPSILGYASSKPILNKSDFSCFVELRRPAAWPQVILISFGLLMFGSMLVGIVWLAARRARIASPTDPTVILLTWTGVGTLILFALRVRELNKLRRAGSRPIFLAVQGTTLLIENAAMQDGTVLRCESDTIKSFDLLKVGITVAFQRAWEIRIRRREQSTLHIRFVAETHASARQSFELVHQRLFL